MPTTEIRTASTEHPTTWPDAFEHVSDEFCFLLGALAFLYFIYKMIS